VDFNVIVPVVDNCDCFNDPFGNFITSQDFTGFSRNGLDMMSLHGFGQLRVSLRRNIPATGTAKCCPPRYDMSFSKP